MKKCRFDPLPDKQGAGIADTLQARDSKGFGFRSGTK